MRIYPVLGRWIWGEGWIAEIVAADELTEQVNKLSGHQVVRFGANE